MKTNIIKIYYYYFQPVVGPCPHSSDPLDSIPQKRHFLAGTDLFVHLMSAITISSVDIRFATKITF